MKFALLISLSFLTLLPAQEVSLMVYNLQNFLDKKVYRNGELAGTKYKAEEEIQALVNIITSADPDILGICEIGTEDDFKILQERLQAQGLKYPYSEHVDAADSVRHLALLSKYPITQVHSYTQFTYKIGKYTYPLRRGLLHTEIQVGDHTLHALGAHLKSKRPAEYADQAVMRLKEAYLIREQIDKILSAAPQSNLLLYGDLNDSFQSSTLKALKGNYRSEKRLEPLDLTAPNGSYWTHYWSYERIYSTFDYALCNRSLLKHVDQEKSSIYSPKNVLIASDHRPLMIYFNFE